MREQPGLHGRHQGAARRLPARLRALRPDAAVAAARQAGGWHGCAVTAGMSAAWKPAVRRPQHRLPHRGCSAHWLVPRRRRLLRPASLHPLPLHNLQLFLPSSIQRKRSLKHAATNSRQKQMPTKGSGMKWDGGLQNARGLRSCAAKFCAAADDERKGDKRFQGRGCAQWDRARYGSCASGCVGAAGGRGGAGTPRGGRTAPRPGQRRSMRTKSKITGGAGEHEVVMCCVRRA